MKRICLLVMDSFGIGSASDAASFGEDSFSDEGANTLGHIAETLALAGTPLQLPNLARLGLVHARLAIVCVGCGAGRSARVR